MNAEPSMPLQAVVIPVTPLAQNCSLFWCTKTMKGAFVDPGGEMDKLLQAAAEEKVEIERILVTHGHSDHAGNVAALARQLGVPVEGPHEDDLFWIERIPESLHARYGRAVEPDARCLCDCIDGDLLAGIQRPATVVVAEVVHRVE